MENIEQGRKQATMVSFGVKPLSPSLEGRGPGSQSDERHVWVSRRIVSPSRGPLDVPSPPKDKTLEETLELEA